MSGAYAIPRHDARVEAWLTAYNILESARELMFTRKGKAIEPLPDLYWAYMAQANTLMALAHADESVGEEAGQYLTSMREQELLRKDDMKKMSERLFGGNDD